MSSIQIDWNKLFSNRQFQKGWHDVIVMRLWDYDNVTHEYALGRLFAAESGAAFPRYSDELPAILARCPAAVAEMDISMRRILDEMVVQSIDGFVTLARELLDMPHTGSVTKGDTGHAGFRTRVRARVPKVRVSR